MIVHEVSIVINEEDAEEFVDFLENSIKLLRISRELRKDIKAWIKEEKQYFKDCKESD